jgi:hypothetical protein
MPTMRFQNLIPHVSGADSDVFGISNTKVDMPHIRAFFGYNAEMIKRHQTA